MTSAVLPPGLAENPNLGRWVSFPAPGKVTISTGKVEIGQGVLTAMMQLAAEELDVAVARIAIQSGDTDLTPNEGFTAGSQSIQFGGVALRSACAEVRALFLRHAATVLGCATSELAVQDGGVLRNGTPTGQDYWTLATAVDLAAARATGSASPKPVADHTVVGRSAARLDLPAKVFGEAVFIHDMMLDGMWHARVVRQPGRGAKLASIDEAAIRRAARGPIEFVRHGDFLAIVGQQEAAVDAAGTAAPDHVTWQGVEPISSVQQEAAWLLQRPAIDRRVGAPEPHASPRNRQRHEATYTRGHLGHASIAPSCGLALYRDGHLTVWTHSQGVYPLRAALAQSLALDPAVISVRHVQGPGCYGHNGADDAAGDAAIIAARLPGRAIRVRWRRAEEFGFEPVSPAMVVKVAAVLDDAGRPADWTAEIWSGTHSARPGSGNLLGAEALPNPPPAPPPADVPDANGGGATRNADPLYDIPAKRIIHHLVPETPVRTSALRGLGAMPNVFAIESFLDELAERARQDPVQFRLAQLADPRARRVVERVARMAAWQAGLPAGTGRGRGIGFARYKNRAAYAAVVADLEVAETIRLLRIWCAADAGLVVNPDGAANQLEGGIIQSASWVLKEQVRFADGGVSSLDWDGYPVLRFSEVPEIEIEFVAADTDVPLGVGEATAGPTAAAIGNAVSHALGTRIRELPMTRERIMATLLAG
ncbi:MAG: xanthine dehydrogenase family protein molybdopterin-binding subunit [Proteobacteria bacterium]|nr:xanthine dehydrogenase family protein molybdopterin-binding subunit [Pseudomonadota bacterium]